MPVPSAAAAAVNVGLPGDAEPCRRVRLVGGMLGLVEVELGGGGGAEEAGVRRHHEVAVAKEPRRLAPVKGGGAAGGRRLGRHLALGEGRGNAGARCGRRRRDQAAGGAPRVERIRRLEVAAGGSLAGGAEGGGEEPGVGYVRGGGGGEMGELRRGGQRGGRGLGGEGGEDRGRYELGLVGVGAGGEHGGGRATDGRAAGDGQEAAGRLGGRRDSRMGEGGRRRGWGKERRGYRCCLDGRGGCLGPVSAIPGPVPLHDPGRRRNHALGSSLRSEARQAAEAASPAAALPKVNVDA